MADKTTLYFTNPELRDEWDDDIEKMKQYIPVRDKVKWKCRKKECHKWLASINNRTKKIKPRGCPYCANKKICSKENCWCNSLWALNPELRDEWVGDIEIMKTFPKKSNEPVNWKCKSGKDCHQWPDLISNRTCKNPRNCPFCSNHQVCSKENCWCNSFWATNPEMRVYWNGDIEDMKKITYGSKIMVEWKCKTGKICHNFKSPANYYSCPFCTIREPLICQINYCNSLWATHPELMSEWVGDINEMKLYLPNSPDTVNWKCNKTKCKHIWSTTIINRTTFNINCLVCADCSSGKQICSTDYCNSLWALKPELRDEWVGDTEEMKRHTLYSNIPVLWQCKTGKDCHIYHSPISNRTGVNNTGCSFCAGKYICEKEGCWCNSLWTLRPDLRVEWFGDINDMKKYPIASHQPVEWKCNSGHIYPARINNRTIGKTGCPYCRNKTEQKLYDALIPYYPQLIHQFKVDWCMNINQLPYDFVLKEDKIIIELDGPQHFEQVSNWQAPEETHLNDLYKMKCAKANGYSVIRLLQTDVFYDTYDWLTELRANIEKIKAKQRVQHVYMCKDNEYAMFNKSVRKYKLIWKERCLLCDVNHPVQQSSQCN